MRYKTTEHGATAKPIATVPAGGGPQSFGGITQSACVEGLGNLVAILSITEGEEPAWHAGRRMRAATNAAPA